MKSQTVNVDTESIAAETVTGITSEHSSVTAEQTSETLQLLENTPIKSTAVRGEIKPVVLYSSSVIGIVAKPVETFDEDLRKLVADLFETTHFRQGVGLAAPQIGCFKRVAVIHLIQDLDGVEKKLVMVNPQVLDQAGKTFSVEICLSLPGQGVQVKIPRSSEITIEYQDETGLRCQLQANGLLARAIQHEIDHLNGVFILQRATPQQKAIAIGKFRKFQKRLNRQ